MNKKIVNQLQITQVFLKKKEASLKREFFILTKNVDRKHTNYSNSNLFERNKHKIRSVKYIIILPTKNLNTHMEMLIFHPVPQQFRNDNIIYFRSKNCTFPAPVNGARRGFEKIDKLIHSR